MQPFTAETVSFWITKYRLNRKNNFQITHSPFRHHFRVTGWPAGFIEVLYSLFFGFTAKISGNFHFFFLEWLVSVRIECMNNFRVSTVSHWSVFNVIFTVTAGSTWRNSHSRPIGIKLNLVQYKYHAQNHEVSFRRIKKEKYPELPEIYAVKPKNREYKTWMKPTGQPVTLKWRWKGELVIRKVVFLLGLCFTIQKATVSAVKGWNWEQTITTLVTVALDWTKQWAKGEN